MTGRTVRVTAEWALRGKLESDRGYRLLSCSKGVLSPQNFEELLTRYSPGTLETLPQVTVSWIPSDEAGKSYISIAIHQLSSSGRYDVDGRQIVFTKYFCIPYGQLAGGSISYQTMYERLKTEPLPLDSAPPITANLTALGPEVPPHLRLTARVAGLLLSGSPVCIIDADRAGMLERLRFIDGVMALLPYGLRSRMSASTWTSSTTQRHKFRLFFSNSPRVSRDRSERDHVVSWTGRYENEQIGLFAPDRRGLADLYVARLESWERPPVAELAKMVSQVTFTRSDIERVLDWLRELAQRSGPAALTAPGPVAGNHQPQRSQDEGMPADPADEVESLLNSCARQLQVPDSPDLKAIIASLGKLVGNPKFQSSGRRAQYWNIITGYGLLRPRIVGYEFPLYETLLRVAFGSRPLSYEAYCQIEESLGGPPPRALAEAIDRMGIQDIRLQVIVSHQLSNDAVQQRFRTGALDASQLIGAAATEELKSDHFRIVCETIIRGLSEPSLRHRFRDIELTLRRYGYLAPMLERRVPGDQQYQVSVLSRLLQGALGGRLDGKDATRVLAEADANAPTSSLLAAVSLLLVDPADLPVVLRAYVIGYAKYAGLNAQTSTELLSLFARAEVPPPDRQVMEPPTSAIAPYEPGAEQQLAGYQETKSQKKGWWWRRPPAARVHEGQPDAPDNG